MDSEEHAGEAGGKLLAFRQIVMRLLAGRELLAEPVDPLIGGLDAMSWLSLYHACHEPSGFGGMRRVEWPAAGGLENQAYVIVAMFAVLGTEVEAESNRNGQRS